MCQSRFTENQIIWVRSNTPRVWCWKFGVSTRRSATGARAIDYIGAIEISQSARGT